MRPVLVMEFAVAPRSILNIRLQGVIEGMITCTAFLVSLLSICGENIHFYVVFL